MAKSTVIVGPIGSGKTTLALALAAKLRAEGGSVLVLDKDLVRNPALSPVDYAEYQGSIEILKSGMRKVFDKYDHIISTVQDGDTLPPKIDRFICVSAFKVTD